MAEPVPPAKADPAPVDELSEIAAFVADPSELAASVADPSELAASVGTETTTNGKLVAAVEDGHLTFASPTRAERRPVSETADRTEPRAPSPRRRRLLPVVALAALPWTWFLVRDTTPGMDAVAAALPLLVLPALLAAIVVTLVSRRRRRAGLVVTASILTFLIVAVLGPRTPTSDPAPPHPIRIVSANLFLDNPTPEAAVRALIAQRADVLVVVEADSASEQLLSAAGYPYVVKRAGIGVYSRFPLSDKSTGGIDRPEVARVRVFGADGGFTLLAVHSMNPSHEESYTAQLAFARGIQALATRGSRPVVLAGDLNATDRGQVYRTLDGPFRDAMRSGWAGSTYENGWWSALFLRIDHVFIPPTWCSSASGRIDVPGSDHRGVATSIGPCPAGG